MEINSEDELGKKKIMFQDMNISISKKKLYCFKLIFEALPFK